LYRIAWGRIFLISPAKTRVYVNGVRAFVRLCARRYGRVLHRILHRLFRIGQYRQLCGVSIVGFGNLGIVLHRHRGRIANPHTVDIDTRLTRLF